MVYGLMLDMNTTQRSAANTNLDALAELRKIARGSRGLRSITERGIALLYRGRYESSAAKVAELVAQAGGDVWSKRKHGNMVVSNYTTTRTWRVEFTIGHEIARVQQQQRKTENRSE